ncbi:MAG: hypothetical protein ABEI86_08325 [Halobacteriaceae archaeon]
MERSFSTLTLRDDSRGVSEVIGFVMIFAILVIAFSLYQAQLIPNQNEQVEFQHFQDVRDDMVEVHATILEAGQADVAQYPTVTLGTTYPPRLLGVNPPPPVGTLRTTQAYSIQIIDPGTGSMRVPTRFLVYTNGYNYLDIAPIWYENSVLYLDPGAAGGNIAIFEDQQIVRPHSPVRVTALQNEFQESGLGDITLNIYPAATTGVDLEELSGEVTVKIPTRLSGEAYWDDAIGSIESNGDWEYQGTQPYKGIYRLVLTVNAEALKFNTVGINAAPERQQAASLNIGPSERGEDDIYKIEWVKAEAADHRNNIHVTFQINTTDENAQVKVQSLQDDGDIRDHTDLRAVSADQPQTVTVKGDNQADQIRVILYNAAGAERASETIPYNQDKNEEGRGRGRGRMGTTSRSER